MENSDYLKNLNENQLEAVKTIDGPVMVFAGAGTGKTRTLISRIVYMIKECNIQPYHILAITFTNKASREMSDRLYKMIGEKANYAQVSTFHSFGVKILRENYKYLGYDKNLVIMDSDDTISVIKRLLKEEGLDPKVYNPNAIRNKISGCKNEMMSPSDYEKYAISDFEKIVLIKKYLLQII